ncbi:unnamed protein product [Cuscuta europaea]|nr:unnamed protein product [Cuscuta europaea]
MASFILRFTQQAQLPACPLSYCKHTSPLNHLKTCSSYSPSVKLALEETYQEIPSGSVNHSENRSGFSSFSPNVIKVGRKHPTNSHAEANIENRVTIKERSDSSPIKRKAESSAFPCAKSNNGSSGGNDEKCKETKMEKKGNRPRKRKLHSREAMLRVGLGMCSKRGDVLSAIRLYEMARKEGVKLDQYHYSVLLYICSSAAAAPAATDILLSAKSGSEGGFEATSASSSHMENSKPDNGALVSLDKTMENEFSLYGFPSKVIDNNSAAATLDELVQLIITSADTFEEKDERAHKEGYIVQVSPDVKSFALDKGFEIFELSQSEKVPMNEAIFTSAARLSMSLCDGDMAFSLVKRMKEFRINPRLRSYGPALHCFCNNGDVEKAFMVEAHMLENGVCPEEPELEALLKASVEAERSDKVYYVLHKLRTNARQVSPSTAHVIEKWFHSKCSSRVGKRKWNQDLVRQAIENGGGGWHGMGWLGNGKWTVSRTSVRSDGICKCCGEQLATIDLDPKETENFAQSVASIAAQREKKSNFQKFQKWLDDYGPFEAVIDGANVGLLNQRNFKPSKVNVVANGIRQMFPSKKWPLIILHNRRVNGDKLHKPFEKALIEKWRTADALYETPTGSNDDW